MKKSTIALAILLLCGLVLSACGVNNAVYEGVSATLTKQAWEAEQADARHTEEVAAQQTLDAAAMFTPTPAIIHVDVPVFSTGFQTFVTDISSEETAPDKNALGDYFQMNKLERPFSSDEMDYFGDLDITRVDLKYDAPWFFATMFLVEDLRDSGDIHYALELDLDADGRGDILIWASLPPDQEWTTEGVQVLEDQNDDIGGIYPLHMEDPNPDLNGYETVIFDAGIGEDPDLAWVRRDPEAPNQLQFAYKDSLTEQLGYLWSAWADGGLMDPGLFDYNDQFTYDGAGSPSNENINYPVKLVELADSTCRSWYGMTPTGTEPGLCGVEQAEKKSGGKKGPKNGPKTGFCVESIAAAGCGNNPCQPACPVGSRCVPCTLP